MRDSHWGHVRLIGGIQSVYLLWEIPCPQSCSLWPICQQQWQTEQGPASALMTTRPHSKGSSHLITRVGLLIFLEISAFEKRRCLILMDDDPFASYWNSCVITLCNCWRVDQKTWSMAVSRQSYPCTSIHFDVWSCLSDFSSYNNLYSHLLKNGHFGF